MLDKLTTGELIALIGAFIPVVLGIVRYVHNVRKKREERLIQLEKLITSHASVINGLDSKLKNVMSKHKDLEKDFGQLLDAVSSSNTEINKRLDDLILKLLDKR